MPVSLTCSCSSCPAHKSPAESLKCPFYPSSSLTDPEWTLLEPLLPLPGNHAGRGGRPEKWPRRLVLDAVFYLVRGGIAWAQLPHDFPPAKTVYDIISAVDKSRCMATNPRCVAGPGTSAGRA